MESKQTLMEELVTRYFLQRNDTLVTFENSGVYHVALNSPSARQDFFGSAQLRLVFDPERAAENPDAELITSAHSLLDVIRNDLERDIATDPRLSQARVVLQLLDADGALRIPQLNFSTPPRQVDYHQSFVPFYILTYQVIYDSDQKFEDTLRLCYNAMTGQLQQELLSQLDKLLLIGAHPDPGDLAPRFGLELLLQQGQREVQARLATDLQEMMGQIQRRLTEDKERLSRNYQAEVAELRSNDTIGHQQLETRLQKNIEELETKYAYRVSVKLLSVLRVWWPQIAYSVTFLGSHQELTLGEIRYDLKTGQTRFQECAICGNRTDFQVCTAGQHVQCGGRCRRELANCHFCGDSMCPDHGGTCKRCAKQVCINERRECHYGKHLPSTFFCPDCFVKSFEGQPLCCECLDLCSSCGRSFAHEHIRHCRIGGELLCSVDHAQPCASLCQECGEAICKPHGIETAELTRVCNDHADESTCCNRSFACSRLASCVIDNQERLCPDTTHRFNCSVCGHAVCETHSFSLRKHLRERVCANDRLACSNCDSEYSYITSDLLKCKICGKLVCSDHCRNCAACGKPTCLEHIIISARGELLCEADAGTCKYCKPEHSIYRRIELIRCDICGESHCLSHDQGCPVCGRTHMCGVHLAKLTHCASCGRPSCGKRSCSPTMFRCSDCEMSYCLHCVNKGRCITCNALLSSPTQHADEQHINFLQNLLPPLSGDEGEIGRSMLRYSHEIQFRYASNQSNSVYLYFCNPGFIQKLLNGDWSLANKQLRIVTSNDRQVIGIKAKILG